MKTNTRRDFLKIISMAPVGSLLLNVGCSDSDIKGIDSSNPKRDGGSDSDTGLSGRDTNRGSDLTSGDSDLIREPDFSDTEDVLESCELTGSDVEGPFYVEGAPTRTTIAGPAEPGERLLVRGEVVDENCRPLAGVLLDVWHADTDGAYHDETEEYRLRGQMMSGTNGQFEFRTIRPGRYPLGGSERPAHIHFIASKPGFQPLTTQLYFSGDPFLSPNDACGGGCNSGDPTLIVDVVVGDPSTCFFQIVLSN